MSLTPSLCGSRGSAHFSSAILRDTDEHPFPGQRLGYYAEGPEPYSSKYKSQEKNKKPSVFIKAFQWYTQEHGTEKNPANDKQEIGFAAWLDKKYEQYIWDIHSKDVTLKSEDRSTAQQSTAGQQASTCKSDKPRGFQRILKSPWRKRRLAAKSPEEGHDSSECRPSWQIILRPKSMSRLPSDICAQKLSLNMCASSNVTVASSDTQVTARTYSERLGIVVQESAVRANDVGNEDSNFNRSYKAKTMKQKLNSQHIYMFREKNISNITISKKNIKCECPIVTKENIRTDKKDLHTKYAPNAFRSKEKSLSNTNRSRGKNKFSVKNSKTSIKCECRVLSKPMHVSIMEASTQYDPNIFESQDKPRDNITSTKYAPETFRPDEKSLSNITTPRYGENNTFSVKDSKPNVTCDCPVLPEGMHANLKDLSTQYDSNVLESQKKSRDNIPKTIFGDKNSSKPKDAKIKGNCACSVVLKEKDQIDVNAQNNPNILHAEEKPLRETIKTICRENSSSTQNSEINDKYDCPDKSFHLIDAKHRERRRSDCCGHKSLIQTTTQTTDQITLPNLVNR